MRRQKWLMPIGAGPMQVVVEWSQGFVSTFLTHWVDPESNNAMSQQSLKVIGTGGRLESDQTRRGVHLVTDEGGVEDINPYFCQPYEIIGGGGVEYRGYGIDSVLQLLEDLRALNAGRRSLSELDACRPTFRQALISTAVAQGASLSLERGGRWASLCEDLTPRLT